MSTTLRILLIILSILSFILCVRSISKAKMKVSNSVVWMIGSILLILISIFPKPIMWLSSILGFISPSNFVFFIMIIFLLIELFSADKRISELSYKLKELDHYLALKDYDERNEDNKK